MFKLFLLASIYIFALGKIDKVQIATIQFKVIQNGDSDRRYIWLHGDEQTARMALESHMKKNQGKAFLVEGILRESEFYGGIIDPNRIFSSLGAKANIQKYNPRWTRKEKEERLRTIDKDRKIFFKKIFPKNGELLIALHNNYKGYNINKELGRSDAKSVKNNQNPRDFFICTNRSDFEILSQSPFNVVLQEESPKKDDGSLSWAAIRNDIRYINIETRLGWLSQQKKMLNYIEKNLR
ncbi:MAG: hypothetical protein ACKVKJ_08110 [Fidelibacterota bacterium]